MEISQPNDSNNKQRLYYGLALSASLIYLGLIFFAPRPTNNNFNFSQLQIILLQVTIVIPYVATWWFAAYGLSKLERYIALAKDKNDTVIRLLGSVRSGLFWIIISTMLVAVIGGIRSYFATNTDILPFFTIVTNYLYVFPQLIGFFLIYRGVYQLQTSQEMSEHRHSSHFLTTIVVLFVACIYVYLLATNPTRQFSADPAIPATYYLPDVLILFTIILPILASWWLGFSAAFTMSDLIPYLTRAELFKGLTRIVYGIWSIIFTSILIQALLSLGGTRLYGLGISVILLILYIFVILQGIGYLFIALGSKALQKSI